MSPEDVRHFRLAPTARTSVVRGITLPTAPEEESKFVREAVRSHPELYFARFAILGEGASEEVVIPRIAKALGFHIDRSFVAVVPLGGRHVNHLWRLLEGLEIPHATLLDLDVGRAGGGWGRIKSACRQLLKRGVSPEELFGEDLQDGDAEATLASFDGRKFDGPIVEWTKRLREFGVFFAEPLDLDMLMLRHFPNDYKRLPDGLKGPSGEGDGKEQAVAAVLGSQGEPARWSGSAKELFPWYRYLFLGRSKPDSHLRVLSQISDTTLRDGAPPVLVSLLASVGKALASEPREPANDAG